MAIEIFDEIECDISPKIINDIYERFLQYFNLPDEFDIELNIVDEDTIKQTNLQSREINKVTDVLSFPNVDFVFPYDSKNFKVYDRNPITQNLVFGEIMLCYKRAQQQAQEYGHSLERELSYLVLHGLLHLAGFDHIEENDRTQMRLHEENILASLGTIREKN